VAGVVAAPDVPVVPRIGFDVAVAGTPAKAGGTIGGRGPERPIGPGRGL
jgi:hypothetical protein